ncbi:MAG: Hpt domain-containing protein [Bacteroidota bacterium]
MDDKKLIDTDWLKSQYRGNMYELLTIYKRENDECVSRMQSSLKAGDHDDVRAVAHKMKGSSRIIGAFSIEDLANLIERTFDVSEMESKVAELQEHYVRLRVEIDKLTDR